MCLVANQSPPKGDVGSIPTSSAKITMEKLKDFRDMLTFGALFVLGFIWMETQYVNASELQQYIIKQTDNEIFYLEQKKKRLERDNKKLELEDELLLDKLKREQPKKK